jgi:hypothetical protein
MCFTLAATGSPYRPLPARVEQYQIRVAITTALLQGFYRAGCSQEKSLPDADKSLI